MPYVPPHLRVSSENSRKPAPVAPPSSSERNPPQSRSWNDSRSSNQSRGRNEFIPDVNIYKSRQFINRFLVVLKENANIQRLEFVRFIGETFAHLERFNLYTLRPASKDAAEIASKEREENSFDSSEMFSALSLQESPKPWKIINQALKIDLIEALERLKAYAKADGNDETVPMMWLRVGKLIFHQKRGWFNWSRTYTPNEVESEFKRNGDLLKTFDNSLSEEDFNHLQSKAKANALQTWTKDLFLVEVVDYRKGDVILRCVCSPSQESNKSNSETESPPKQVLELIKIKMHPIRQMVADVACIGKDRDLRIAFMTKKYVNELTEDELQDLKSSFSKAYIDDTVKGGLHWPMGSDCSISGRFKVVSSMHETATRIVAGGVKWKFQKCNRVEFKATSGRVSHEVSLKPVLFNELREGSKEWSTDDLLSSLEDVIDMVWETYL